LNTQPRFVWMGTVPPRRSYARRSSQRCMCVAGSVSSPVSRAASPPAAASWIFSPSRRTTPGIAPGVRPAASASMIATVARSPSPATA
jgi:hypothetical protein